MRPPLHNKFVEKSVGAMIAAIEIYNKPSFNYREECFSLLCINAWELLLKAKVLQNNDNKINSIRVYERRRTKDGKESTKRYLKKNRSGNPLTISIAECISKITDGSNNFPAEVAANILSLIEIRDNVAHTASISKQLAKIIFEIASAAIKNYILISKQWFKIDFSDQISLMLPLAFLGQTSDVPSVKISSDEGRLAEFLKRMIDHNTNSENGFEVAIRFNVKIERSSTKNVSKVRLSNDSDALKIVLSEDDFRNRYPWEFKELIERLKKRYLDFKQDKNFHKIHTSIKSDSGLSNIRYLDIQNPRSLKKVFYSTNCLAVFDKQYKIKS